jgi:hypothetical protein
MEVLISIENFEEAGGKYREINSPRSLEACLRTGLDPSELYPRSKHEFKEKGLTKEMLDIKYTTFENKRRGKSIASYSSPNLPYASPQTNELPLSLSQQDKITIVKNERASIIAFTEKRARSASPERGSSPQPAMTAAQLREAEAKRAQQMIEMVSEIYE